MVFHRDVEKAWPPFQRWHSKDQQFRLVRTGVFPAYDPVGGRLLSNDGPGAIVSKNARLLADKAHLMKNVASMAGGPSSRELSVQIEDAAKAGDFAKASALSDRLATELAGLRQALTAFVAAHTYSARELLQRYWRRNRPALSRRTRRWPARCASRTRSRRRFGVCARPTARSNSIAARSSR